MGHIDRSEAQRRIKEALRRRTGRTWNVSGDRGTAWGWLNVHAPTARRVDGHYLSAEDQLTLGEIFKSSRDEDGQRRCHFQGVSISPDLREWHVAAAEGRIQPAADGNGWDITDAPAAPEPLRCTDCGAETVFVDRLCGPCRPNCGICGGPHKRSECPKGTEEPSSQVEFLTMLGVIP